jgi:hypothetical protein
MLYRYEETYFKLDLSSCFERHSSSEKYLSSLVRVKVRVRVRVGVRVTTSRPIKYKKNDPSEIRRKEPTRK